MGIGTSLTISESSTSNTFVRTMFTYLISFIETSITITGWWINSMSFTGQTVSSLSFTSSTLIVTKDYLGGTDWNIFNIS